ncbi:MAG: alpha/beta hydrolase [Burkholderiaceae bacterium]
MSLLECIEVETAESPTAAVIWMHGLGADGNDFVPIVREFDMAGCPPIRFVFPHAPTMPVTINGGYVMRAWYDIFGADLVRREDESGIRQSAAQIEALIAREKARGLASTRIVLAGFSQGCAMTLFTGLRHAEPLAGLIALSGYLPIADKTTAERNAVNQQTPIFMAHGTHDGVIPIGRAEASRDALTQLGYAVQWHSYPMQHGVHPDEIDAIAAFLSKVLS